MKNLEYFKTQIIGTSLVTHDLYEILNRKTYSSGRKIEIGDNVLYGILETKKDDSNCSYTLTTLHQDELGDIYDTNGYLDADKDKLFPILILL
jgi:hypothetical protein